MYAVVEAGSKQVKVSEGDIVRVEKIDAPIGDTVELTKVCMIAKDDNTVVNPDSLAGAKVLCEVLSQGRHKKITVFKKKRRKGYTRKQGHRQPYTELRIREIQA